MRKNIFLGNKEILLQDWRDGGMVFGLDAAMFLEPAAAVRYG